MKNEKKSLRQMVDENPIFLLSTNKSRFYWSFINDVQLLSRDEWDSSMTDGWGVKNSIFWWSSDWTSFVNDPFGDCYLTNAIPHSFLFSVLLIQHRKFVEQHLILLFVPSSDFQCFPPFALPTCLLLSMSSFFVYWLCQQHYEVCLLSHFFCCLLLPFCRTFSIFFGHILSVNVLI